jgi:hypothetical protein
MKLNSLFRNREGKREGLVWWGFEILVYPTFKRESERERRERERTDERPLLCGYLYYMLGGWRSQDIYIGVPSKFLKIYFTLKI